jgi:hypothetical protein
MTIPGWNRDITPWQERHAHLIPEGGTYLEVGVLFGASLVTMARLRPDIQLIAVDPWRDSPTPGWCGASEFGPVVEANGGDLFLAFLRLMLEHAPDVLKRTRVIRGSADTVTLHTPVDMLFIDGNHAEPYVRADLLAYGPLVKRGGVVAGHDYSPDYPGVIAAVDDFFGHKPETMQSVWWYRA